MVLVIWYRVSNSAAWPASDILTCHFLCVLQCVSIGLVDLQQSNPRLLKGGKKGIGRGRRPQTREVEALKTKFTSQYVWNLPPSLSRLPPQYIDTPQPNRRISINCLVMATEVEFRDLMTTYLLQFPSQLFHFCPGRLEMWEVRWPKTTQYMKTE